jgi:hypothetical protein
VVALVHDHEPVPVENRRIVSTGHALEHRDVDETGCRVLAATDLADTVLLETEVFGES